MFFYDFQNSKIDNFCFQLNPIKTAPYCTEEYSVVKHNWRIKYNILALLYYLSFIQVNIHRMRTIYIFFLSKISWQRNETTTTTTILMLQWSSCLLHGTFFSPVFTTSHLERKKDIALKMKWFSFENFAQQVFMFPWAKFPPISHLVRPFCAASVSTCGVKWQSWRKFCLHYACRFFLSFGFFFHSFAFFFFICLFIFLCRCFGCSQCQMRLPCSV